MAPRTTGIAAFLLLVLILSAGCDRGPSRATARSVSPGEDIAPKTSPDVATRTASARLPDEDADAIPDPVEAITQWRHWRDQKRYRLIAPHIDAAQRTAFIDTLVAVDLFLRANEDACTAIADVLGAHRTELWDLSSLGTGCGIFSPDLQIVQIDRDGDRAAVIFQVGERLPLENAELRLAPQGWIYVPGAGPFELPTLMKELAVTLTEVADTIRTERPDSRRINQEYRLRIFPRIRELQDALAPPLQDDP